MSCVFLGVPFFFVLRGLLVVCLAVSDYMVLEPVSLVLVGRASLGHPYLIRWRMVCCLALVALRFVLSSVVMSCVWSSVCWGGSYRSYVSLVWYYEFLLVLVYFVLIVYWASLYPMRCRIYYGVWVLGRHCLWGL